MLMLEALLQKASILNVLINVISSSLDRLLESKKKRENDRRKGRNSDPTSQISSFQNTDIEKRKSESLQFNTPLDSGITLRVILPGTATIQITLLGALKLPTPKTYGLDEQHIKSNFSLFPEVNKLDQLDY